MGFKFTRKIPTLIFVFLILFYSFYFFSVKAEKPDKTGAVTRPHFEVKTDKIQAAGVPFEITITAFDSRNRIMRDFAGTILIKSRDGKLGIKDQDSIKPVEALVGFEQGVLVIKNLVVDGPGENVIIVESDGMAGEAGVKFIPGYLAVLPPLLAIILALTIKQVVISLLFGIWLGAAVIYGFNPLMSLMRVLDTILIESIASVDHICIIVFSLFLGGMVAVISRSGGNHGMVDVISRWARTTRSGQLATWAMGLIIFFDDYANTLLVGNAMRPLTDKLKISREKLAFIVDATAAPVTSIALISTWIGFEISLIGDSLDSLGVGLEPYVVFIQSIPFRFYPLMLLLFIFMVGYMMRDFGPMLKAEERARTTGQVLGPDAKPLSNLDDEELLKDRNVPRRWYNAIIPIACVILFTIGGLWYSGTSAIAAEHGKQALVGLKPYKILNEANSFYVLLWASFGGSLVAIIMVMAQKIMNLEEAVTSWIDGVKSILPAIIILSLAWSIGSICKELKTAQYLALVARGNIAPQLLPALIFLISAVIAFATGTSWGTMSIVMPIAVYIGYTLPPEALKESILLGSVAGVLAGSTFGDHCSPISDTTIMSSMASACDHIDHVRTQMPYALTVGLVSVFVGSIPSGYGINPWIMMIPCALILFGILKYFGKNPDQKKIPIK
ncbi:MAG: Na+/H+ antiporter NhaC family protein [Vulcanimicrobiota bacterium]